MGASMCIGRVTRMQRQQRRNRLGGRAGLALLLLVAAGCSIGDPIRAEPAPARSTARTPLTESVTAAARAAHTATSLKDGSVLVAGGCVVDGCERATNSAVLLRSEGDDGLDEMIAARDAHTATLLESGDVLVAGGFGDEGLPPLKSAEVFNPRTGTWSAAPPMHVGRGGHAAARLGDGQVLEAGGWIGPGRYTDTTEIYNATTGRFEEGPSLPEAVDGLAAVSLPGGSVLIAGGQARPGVATSSAVVVSADGALTRVGSMAQARFKHTIVALPDGRALVIGGTSNDTDLLSSTEVYDPQTRRFTPGPSMSSGRYKLSGSATLAPDGKVVVAGGGPGVEVIDLARGASAPLPGGGTTRSAFSTANVIGSKVRVIGGYDRGINLTRTDLSIPLASLDS